MKFERTSLSPAADSSKLTIEEVPEGIWVGRRVPLVDSSSFLNWFEVAPGLDRLLERPFRGVSSTMKTTVLVSLRSMQSYEHAQI